MSEKDPKKAPIEQETSSYRLLQRIEYEAPTDPEDQFAAIVNACHLELGALAFLCLDTNLSGQTAQELSITIDPEASWQERRDRQKQIGNYFNHVFINVALVAKETYIQDRVGDLIESYSLTPFGKYVQGIGYFHISSITRLNKQEKTSLSLHEILTKSAHGKLKDNEESHLLPAKRRGPYIRARLFEELSYLTGRATMQANDLAKALEVSPSTIARHARSLQASGLVEYTKINTEKQGQFKYSMADDVVLPDEFIFPYKLVSGDIGRLVYEYIKAKLIENPAVTFDVYSITEALYPLHTKDRGLFGKSNVSKNTFYDMTSKVLAYLLKNNYLNAEFVAGVQSSHINLTDLGKKVARIIMSVKNACYDPEIAEMMDSEFRSGFRGFLHNNRNILLELQRQGNTKKPREERFRSIINLLIEPDQKLRSTVLERKVGCSIGLYLVELKEAGILEQEWGEAKGVTNPGKRGRASYYRLTSKAREIIMGNPNIPYEQLRASVEESNIN